MAVSSSTFSSSRLWAIAGFLALIVAGDQGCGRLLQRAVDGSEFRFSTLYRGEVDADLVIVGNSRAVASLPPQLIAERTGRSAYSIGYNGLNPELSTALVADLIERSGKPALILAEISFVASKPAPVSDFKIYIGHSPRLRAILERHTPKLAFAARASRLFRVNAEFFYRALYYRGRSDQRWMNRGRMSADKLRAVTAAEAEPLALYPENLPHLRRLMELCDREGIELRLIVAPFLPATRDKLEIDAWLAKLRRHVSFEDYSSGLDDPAQFADRIHTNERGAAALIDQLFGRPTSRPRP
jgi:hypothetical protein